MSTLLATKQVGLYSRSFTERPYFNRPDYDRYSSYYHHHSCAELLFDSYKDGARRDELVSLDENSAMYKSIVQKWDGHTAVLTYIPRNFDVFVNGGGASIHILGDVCDGARIFASGGGAKIIVDGSVCNDATLHAIGGGASVKISGLTSLSATLSAEGGGAEVDAQQTQESITSISPEIAEIENAMARSKTTNAHTEAIDIINAINAKFGIDFRLSPQLYLYGKQPVNEKQNLVQQRITPLLSANRVTAALIGFALIILFVIAVVLL